VATDLSAGSPADLNSGSAADLVARLLAVDATLAVAESCTGGGVLAALTSVPGASACIWGGGVVYSNEAKHALLGIGHDLVATAGPVSSAVTRELARSVRTVSGATYGAAVTGWAGPGHGDEPVGTVYIAVAHGDQCECRRAVYDGDRHRVRAQAVTAVIAALHAALCVAPGESS
jgi:PncC family amidohydrolase